MSNNEIIDAYSALRRELSLILSEELKAINFGYNQMLIVFHLMNSALPMSELSAFCRSDPASTSRTVASLEKAGLVKRRLDKDDSRKVILELTRKGEARAQEAELVRHNISDMLNGTLTENEKKEFVKLLNKVSTQLKKVKS